jgi:hypothetical protein
MAQAFLSNALFSASALAVGDPAGSLLDNAVETGFLKPISISRDRFVYIGTIN